MTATNAPIRPAQPDTATAQHVREHHAEMVAELDRLTAALLDDALMDDGPDGQQQARTELAEWFERVLVPHADEEESTTYHAAAELPEGRLLIEAMVREHVLIKRLVALFAENESTVAAAYARAAFEVFNSHQAKENEIILPLLLNAADVSLAEVLSAGHGHQATHHEHERARRGHGHH